MAGPSPAMTISRSGETVGGLKVKIIFTTCAALLLLAGGAAAQDGDKTIQKTTLVMGTATQGGGFPVYGNAFAEVIAEADPTLSIQTRNTMGSSENMPMMEAAKLDLGLVAGESFYPALQGVGRPPLKLKI